MSVPSAAALGGIDLGGTKIQAVVVDAEHAVLGQARRPTPVEGGPEAVAQAMTEAVEDAASQADMATADLRGVGVGSPGQVDTGAGTVARAANLPDWDEPFALGAALSEALGTRVALGNDVQTATDGEFHLGAARPYRSVLGVFWGTGVGGGVVLDGRPWTGRGSAGEIGHIVIEREGAPCTCGRRGCMEAYAGRAAMEIHARRVFAEGTKTKLFKIAEKKGRTRLTAGIWERALRKEDPLAVELIDRAVRAIGVGVASALNVLDVEAVVVGGGLGVRFGEPYVRRIEAAMMPHLFTDRDPPAIHVAELGDLGGAIGASLLVS